MVLRTIANTVTTVLQRVQNRFRKKQHPLPPGDYKGRIVAVKIDEEGRLRYTFQTDDGHQFNMDIPRQED